MDQVAATPQQQGTREISVLDLALVFGEHRRILILVPLVAGLIALAVSFAIRPTFTGTTKILLPQQQTGAAAALANQLNTLAGLAGAGVGMKNASDTYVAMMKSRTVADRLLKRFNLKELYKASDDDGARAALASRTSIFAGKDNMITVSTEDHDPKRAAELANAYVDELRNLTQTLAVTEASQRRLFFEGQMKQAKDDLTKAEVALRSSGVSEATLKTVPQSALEALARLKAQITAQEVKLASLRGYMTESNPDVTRAQQELAALRHQLSRSEQNDSHKAGPADAEYVTKFRDFKYQETLYELMARQTELAKLDEARDGAIVQVVDAALPPERKSKPRKAMIAMMTTLVTFLLMVLVVFVKQALRNAQSDAATSSKLARLRAYMRL
jgi:tyrosine-protein kinase Etk/Wzc